MDTKTGELRISPVTKEQAEKEGWARRARFQKK